MLNCNIEPTSFFMNSHLCFESYSEKENCNIGLISVCDNENRKLYNIFGSTDKYSIIR